MTRALLAFGFVYLLPLAGCLCLGVDTQRRYGSRKGHEMPTVLMAVLAVLVLIGLTTACRESRWTR